VLIADRSLFAQPAECSLKSRPARSTSWRRLPGAKSNLSRTLKTMQRYGLVRLERGERGRITPKVAHDRVELDLPLTWSSDIGRRRKAV